MQGGVQSPAGYWLQYTNQPKGRFITLRKVLFSAAAGLGAVVGLIAIAAGGAPEFSGAADHLDAPFVKKDGRIDINDVYAFRSPSDADNTVLIMTINPLAGVLSPTTLRPGASYELAIDNDGDAVEDVVYRLHTSAPRKDGTQNVVLHRQDGDDEGVIAKGRSGSAIDVDGGGSLIVDVFDDPFFFDLAAFNAGAAFCMGQGGTGTDFFLGLNTSAIVLEVPTGDLLDNSSNIGVWGRTKLNGEQVERMGRPAINTVFLPPNPFEASPPDPMLEDAFNFGEPADDQASFRDEVVDTLTLLYSLNNATDPNPGDDAATVQALADFLLPDILTVDTASGAGFPNGRRLADDVIDVELGLVTEGLITTDCVANDSSFSSSFPYLAPAN